MKAVNATSMAWQSLRLKAAVEPGKAASYGVVPKASLEAATHRKLLSRATCCRLYIDSLLPSRVRSCAGCGGQTAAQYASTRRELGSLPEH